MSRGLKIGLGAVGILVVLVVVAGVFLWSNLSSIVRAAVEKAGTEVTGTQVKLGDVDISLTDGSGTLSGFRVVNPSGFERDDAFRFDEVTVKLDVASITSDPVIVKEVVVDGPAIVYELAEGGSNIEKIQKNVDDFGKKQKGGSGKASGSSGESTDAADEGPNVIIENLYLKNGTVSVRASQFTSKKITVPMPTVHMTDIGKKEGGAGPAEIAESIMSEITDSVTDAVADVNFGELLEGAGAEAEALLDSVGEGASSVTKGVGEKADEVGSSLKKLFGN